MTGLGSVGICFSYDTCSIPDYQLGSKAASILILAVKEERRIPSLFLRQNLLYLSQLSRPKLSRMLKISTVSKRDSYTGNDRIANIDSRFILSLIIGDNTPHLLIILCV
jgi:hypothetical protein